MGEGDSQSTPGATPVSRGKRDPHSTAQPSTMRRSVHSITSSTQASNQVPVMTGGQPGRRYGPLPHPHQRCAPYRSRTGGEVPPFVPRVEPLPIGRLDNRIGVGAEEEP